MNDPAEFRRPAELPRAARRRGHLEQLHHHRQIRADVGRAARWWSASARRCCSTAPCPAKGLLTTLMLLPMMMCMAVVGLFWQLLYNPSWGIINYLLGTDGEVVAVEPRRRAVRDRDHRHLDVVAVRDAAVARRLVGHPAARSTRPRPSTAPRAGSSSGASRCRWWRRCC